MDHLEELTRQFHEVYKQQLLPELLCTVKWKRNQVPLSVGDVVLVDDCTNLVKKYRLGRVQDVRGGGRTVVARFKLSDDVDAINLEYRCINR